MDGTALVAIPGGICLQTFYRQLFQRQRGGQSWWLMATSLLPTLAFWHKGFLLWLGETFWGMSPVGNSPPGPTGIEHSCPEGPRKIGCRGPERWPPTALFFPLSALGGCFLKMNHQPTNPHFCFLGKLRLRHAIHFQIIAKKQIISRVWWLIPVVLAVRRWRQEVSEFKVSLSYIQSSKPAWVIQDIISEKSKSKK